MVHDMNNMQSLLLRTRNRSCNKQILESVVLARYVDVGFDPSNTVSIKALALQSVEAVS